MKWFQALTQNIPEHKYAINAAMLGDMNEFAWSNLGYWQNLNDTYPQACRHLATQLADSIHLNSNDFLLDLGCGKGASLSLWKSDYAVKHIEAVDMQAVYVDKINHSVLSIHKAYCESFLNLDKIAFEFKFDAVLCIDATYHSSLNSFLHSVSSVLNSKARIGFHYLVLTERYYNLNSFEKIKLRVLLKSADIQLSHLNSYMETSRVIERYGFEQVQIQNLSEAVFKGFARYIQRTHIDKIGKWSLDRMKINMTAKLCQKLYADGLIDYVQITAQRAH